jgi:hypothetical protein
LNVGITAACLPTLKPLAADFFGAVSALTSGEAYGSRSRPFHASGYLKQQERSGNNSYALEERKNSRPMSAPDSLEEEFKENAGAYLSNKRRASRAAESDESILPLHQHKGILKTMEVEIK